MSFSECTRKYIINTYEKIFGEYFFSISRFPSLSIYLCVCAMCGISMPVMQYLFFSFFMLRFFCGELACLLTYVCVCVYWAVTDSALTTSIYTIYLREYACSRLQQKKKKSWREILKIFNILSFMQYIIINYSQQFVVGFLIHSDHTICAEEEKKQESEAYVRMNNKPFLTTHDGCQHSFADWRCLSKYIICPVWSRCQYGPALLFNWACGGNAGWQRLLHIRTMVVVEQLNNDRVVFTGQLNEVNARLVIATLACFVAVSGRLVLFAFNIIYMWIHP